MNPGTISAALPLFVAVPLVLAAVSAVLPSHRARVALSLVVPAGVSACAFALLGWTAAHGAVGHGVGAFPGGVAIPFVADPMSTLMLAVAAAVVAVGSWFAQAVGENSSRFFGALTLMMLAGAAGAFLTADLFNFFVFMEVMLLPSYGMIAVTGTWRRLAAGRAFVLVNLLTSTVLLIGVALTYGAVGAVNIGLLAGMAAEGGAGAVALGLVVLALSVKAGLVPVHTWLPRTYPGTSPAVMALFSAIHTKVAVYMLFRIYVVIVGMNPAWHWPLILVMVASMLVGAFAGLAERTMREILAYQMVNGMPFILVTLAFTDGDARAALAAGVFYAVHHMVTVGSLIMGAGAVEETYGTGRLSRLSGLARRDPLVAWVMAAMSLSIVGFPPFSGMFGKVAVVFTAAAGGGARSVVVIAAIIIASIGALLSMARLWRGVFWGRPMQGVPGSLRVTTAKAAPAAALALVGVALFLGAGWVSSWTGAAAEALLDVPGYVAAALGDPAAAIGTITKGVS
ncbi:monovalent cation/H+ antiporter subunit D family protein [Corynebacterium sphenisci]|uniref:monovalent cation/H+ antiporter subunit D family protein n=1 Tax=Corynebacterium sphenisci TaxID=191493 RepID=UPI0026DF2DDD|nr:monovalent cation/H+ antiporter subunit D family protein [Corynebacterium sphenisci]MDO5730955.1 monovalent cation/H+ antiporter subunit D family protein [Corynebacterium sphenisci]